MIHVFITHWAKIISGIQGIIMESSPHQPTAKMPFAPNIISTPRTQVLNPQSINTGTNVKGSLNFGNLTLNDISGLINSAQQSSFLGMLLNSDPVPNQHCNQSGSELNVSGVSGINNTSQSQCLDNSSQQIAVDTPTEYSKPRILAATARDISLTLPCIPTNIPTACPCKRPKHSTSTQYENDPFLGKIFSKEECKTTGTEAFKLVSVSAKNKSYSI